AARAALPVDRRPRGLDRQPGEEADHARDVEALLALLVGAAEDDILDRRGIEAPAREERPHAHDAQVVGADVLEDALLRMSLPDGGADSVDHYDFAHGLPPRADYARLLSRAEEPRAEVGRASRPVPDPAESNFCQEVAMGIGDALRLFFVGFYAVVIAVTLIRVLPTVGSLRSAERSATGARRFLPAVLLPFGFLLPPAVLFLRAGEIDATWTAVRML